MKRSNKSSSTRVTIEFGDVRLKGHLEEELAPHSCVLFRSLAPNLHKAIHCRWSGESMWIPFDRPLTALPFENHTSHPHPSQLLIYAAEFSEPEILLPYGACMFNSKVGVLAGNHFLTLYEGCEHLPELGRRALWKGAQKIKITLG